MSFFKSKFKSHQLAPIPVYSPLEMLRCFSSPPPKQTNTKNDNDTLSYYKNLIQITLIDNKYPKKLEDTLHYELIHGWNISHSIDRTFYRLKPISDSDESIIVIESLNQVLLYSFAHFLDLNSSPNLTDYDYHLQWVYATYAALMNSMTLEQKAMIFCKCSDRKNRKYKLIHKYKDCIIGKEGVDFLINKQISKNRKAAVYLAQEFIDKGYMAHVTNDHPFKDSNHFWYKFFDDNIKHKNDHILRYSDDHKDDSIIVECDDGCGYNLSSDEEDNDFLLRDIECGINSLKTDRKFNINLGSKHSVVIEWLLSLYTMDELQSMFDNEFANLIKSPGRNIALVHSYTDVVHSQCDVEDVYDDDDELFMGYHNKMALKTSNKYYLNVKPFTMKGVSNKQRAKLLNIQSRTFDTLCDVIRFILCDLWDIYNDISMNFYLKMMNRLCLVEKAKMMSIGVETRNRIFHLKKYKHCFVGSNAVTFCVNSRLVSNRESAMCLANLFHKRKWLKHIKNEYGFHDNDYVYTFIDDELENRLDELRLYKQQQQSNHVKLSLDIVASPRIVIYDEESQDSDEILIDWNESISSSHYLSKSTSKRRKSTSLDIEPFFD